MLCQVCGSAAANQGTIETEVPWDLYLVVAVLAIAVIGLWEGFKFCLKKKEARLRALRAKANKASLQKLSKAELKELQRLLAIDPEDLHTDQRFRLVEHRTRFEATMPANTSPVPTVPFEGETSSLVLRNRVFKPLQLSRESSRNRSHQSGLRCTQDLSIKYLDGKRSICSPIAGA